jgi:hypothetical protein
MLAAGARANAGQLLDRLNAELQIGRRVDEMIDPGKDVV